MTLKRKAKMLPRWLQLRVLLHIAKLKTPTSNIMFRNVSDFLKPIIQVLLLHWTNNAGWKCIITCISYPLFLIHCLSNFPFFPKMIGGLKPSDRAPEAKLFSPFHVSLFFPLSCHKRWKIKPSTSLTRCSCSNLGQWSYSTNQRVSRTTIRLDTQRCGSLCPAGVTAWPADRTPKGGLRIK